MQRRKFMGQAGMAGILAAGVAPAVVHAQEAVRWRLASSFPRSLDTLYGGSEVMAKTVKELSGGKFEISVHQGGELMPAFGVLDGVQSGTVEMCHTAPYYFFGKDETFALDCAIPFGLNARAMTAWMLEGGGLKLLREFYANYNIVNFPGGNTGAQMGGWFRKEVKSLKDVEGLKFRMGGFGGKVFAKLGVVPQNIPAGEIYQSLEKGTIDAAEWIGPFDDQRLGLNKVAKFYYYPAWWEGGPQLSFLVNQKAYSALSKEYQAMLDAATAKAHGVVMARYDHLNPTAIKELAASGTVLRAFPREVMTGAFQAAEEVYAELNEKNPNWKKIYPSYAAFRRDSNLWFRFSETGFDSFMQRQKL